MRFAIRELGVVLIALFALNINAQTFHGLPQYGVTLSGTLDSLQIDNSSGRDIIAVALHYRDVHGDGPVDADLVTEHIRTGQVLTSIPWGHSPALDVGKHNVVSVTLDAMVFGDGEYVAAAPGPIPEQNFDAFHLLSIKMQAEQATGRILSAVRSDATKHADAWARLAVLAQQPKDPAAGGMEIATIRNIQERVAGHFLMTRKAKGDKEAFDQADRSSKLPALWRKPMAPPSGIARLIRELLSPTRAQGQYGMFLGYTYTGDAYYGPIYIGTGIYSGTVGAEAQCIEPGFAAGRWMGIYLGPTYSSCPYGSTMSARVIWPYQPTSYILQGLWQDYVPGSQYQQAYWLWYNWCSNINNGPLLSSHCNYACDGSMPCQR